MHVFRRAVDELELHRKAYRSVEGRLCVCARTPRIGTS
jgi:hypothetical protein